MAECLLLAQLFVVPRITEVFQEAFEDVESSIQDTRAEMLVSVYHDEHVVVLQVLH